MHYIINIYIYATRYMFLATAKSKIKSEDLFTDS